MHKVITICAAAAVLCMVSASAHSQTWLAGIRQFILQPRTAQSGAAPGVSATPDGSSVVYTPPLTMTAAHVTVDGVSSGPAFMQKGVTYVALRDFLGEIERLDKSRYEITYGGDGRVSVTRDASPANYVPTGASLFGDALASMWNGQTQSALKYLDRASAATGPNAADAKELDTWLRGGVQEANSAQTQASIVRFDWVTLPGDAVVSIDGQPVNQHALLVTTTAGMHTISISNGTGVDVYHHAFVAQPNIAFVVRFQKPLAASPNEAQ